MATTYLQGSFRAPAAATIRFTRTDTAATVDWAVSQGDTWDSADDLLSEWTAAIQADGGFSSAFSIVASHSVADSVDTCTVTTGGPAYSVAWSHAGDGTALRNWLGESGNITGAADGSSFSSHIPTSYVARYGVVSLTRTTTGHARGHVVTADKGFEALHHWGTQDADDVEATLVLRVGNPTGDAYSVLAKFEAFVDNIWDMTGGGWPIAIYHQPDGNSSADKWAARGVSDRLLVSPVNLDGLHRYWEISLGPLILESTPW